MVRVGGRGARGAGAVRGRPRRVPRLQVSMGREDRSSWSAWVRGGGGIFSLGETC